jgi:uncharacterized protein YlbG (UPF0298 family)
MQGKMQGTCSRHVHRMNEMGWVILNINKCKLTFKLQRMQHLTFVQIATQRLSKVKKNYASTGSERPSSEKESFWNRVP